MNLPVNEMMADCEALSLRKDRVDEITGVLVCDVICHIKALASEYEQHGQVIDTLTLELKRLKNLFQQEAYDAEDEGRFGDRDFFFKQMESIRKVLAKAR